MKVWLNEKFVDERDVSVSLMSHSFSRGLAIFEVVDILSSLRGPLFFGLDEHLVRFYNSARLIYQALPFPKEVLCQACLDGVRENGIKRGVCKIFAYYPDNEFKVISSSLTVSVAIFFVDYAESGLEGEELSAPVTVAVSPFRKTHPETVPVQAKITGSYVGPYLALREANRRGFDEVFMLDTMGFVAEGSTSNVFFIKDRKVVTPYLRCALPGITRVVVMKCLKEMHYIVEERDIRLEGIESCDEAFFSSTIKKIRPIRSIEGRRVGKNCPGPVTVVLRNKLNSVFEGKEASFKSWLTPVE